jgi:hypothetical protein
MHPLGPTNRRISLCYFTTLLLVLILDRIRVGAFSCLNFGDRRSRRRLLCEAHDIHHPLDESTPPTSPPSCPFSKTFPRYRVEITQRRKANRSENNKPLVDISWLTAPWRESTQSGILLEIVGKEKRMIVGKNKDGIGAFAFLWTQSAQLLDKGHEQYIVVYLPDSSRILVQNFVEIINWMKENLDLSDIGSTLLEAELVDAPGLVVPAVRIWRMPTSSSSTHLSAHKNSTTSTNEDVVNRRTRKWVKRMLVEQGICPFTRSDRMSGQGLADLGVPIGSIAYHASFNAHPIALFADLWKAIDEMIAAGPSGRDGISSILLAAPEFDDDFDFWSGPIFGILEASVMAAQAESLVGVVCFHPRYATPDGTSWPGFGHMHSVPRLEKWYNQYCPETELTTEQIAAGGAWQRRTPHATINVLRADQLSVAESRRESGRLYAENIDRLVGVSGIGMTKLELDLQLERQYGTAS